MLVYNLHRSGLERLEQERFGAVKYLGHAPPVCVSRTNQRAALCAVCGRFDPAAVARTASDMYTFGSEKPV